IVVITPLHQDELIANMAGQNGCRVADIGTDVNDRRVFVFVADEFGADANAKIPVGPDFLELEQEVRLGGEQIKVSDMQVGYLLCKKPLLLLVGMVCPGVSAQRSWDDGFEGLVAGLKHHPWRLEVQRPAR
ncbi:MAG: hypothetical protein ACK55I_29205, partial [bacterium]